MILRKLYYYFKLRNSQYLSQEKLKNYQRRRLKNIISLAEDISFYREKWGLKESDEENTDLIDHFESFPLIQRSEIEDICTDFPIESSFWSENTSGSSGESLEIYWSEQAYDFSEALYLRALIASGYKPWQLIAFYWHEEFEEGFLNNYLMRKERVPTDLNLDEQLDLLEEIDARVWYYYAASAYSIAKKVLREDKERDLKPDIIYTQAEILTEEMRDIIEEAFDAKVFDRYGMSELGTIAWECEERKLHLNIDSLYCEFKQTKFGNELICTSLTKNKMPLIRYKTGDIFEKIDKDETCICGRTLPVIKPPEGRKSNFIEGKSPREIIRNLDDVIDFELFQVQKDKEGRIILKYVRNKGFDDSSLDKARNRLEKLFQTEIKLKEVKDLDKTSGGKIQMVVNDSDNRT